MEFKVILTEKTSKGDTTTIKFKPTDHAICDCDSIIVKVPITAQGYFIDSEYTVTITPFVAEVAEETGA